MATDTLYHAHGIGEGALDGLVAAGGRIARATERLHQQPPKPLREIPVPETPEMPQARIETVPARLMGAGDQERGYGLTMDRPFRNRAGAYTVSVHLCTPKSRGSVGGKILEALSPAEILDVTERAERMAAELEEAADERAREIERAVAEALTDADPAIRALAERLSAGREADQEREMWIREHGSLRLRRLLEESIEHDAVYRDERLAAERPGWRYDMEPLPGTSSEPRNPPMDALGLLDEARATAPDARLVYWAAERPCDCDQWPDYCEDEDRHVVRGYTCGARFLGRDIVFRVQDDGTPPVLAGGEE